MDSFLKEFGLQGLSIVVAIILSLVANRRIRALETHDEDQDIDHLELVFSLYESGSIKQDFVRSFIQHKRGMDRASKSNLSDIIDSLLT